MTDQLFNDLPEQLSPYQAWLRRHDIYTTETPARTFLAWQGDRGSEAKGATEAAAIASLVKKNNIPPFGEEELKAIRRL